LFFFGNFFSRKISAKAATISSRRPSVSVFNNDRLDHALIFDASVWTPDARNVLAILDGIAWSMHFGHEHIGAEIYVADYILARKG
jgi:hypothetical protein